MKKAYLAIRKEQDGTFTTIARITTDKGIEWAYQIAAKNGVADCEIVEEA